MGFYGATVDFYMGTHVFQWIHTVQEKYERQMVYKLLRSFNKLEPIFVYDYRKKLLKKSK